VRYGGKGPFRVEAGLDGRFVMHFAGELPESAGFDGAAGWAADWTGMPRPLELADLELAQLLAWALTASWGAPGWPFALAERAGDGENAVIDVAHVDGRLRAELTVERRSALPVSLRFTSPLGTETLLFADWRELDAATLPGRVESRSGAVIAAAYELAGAEAAIVGDAGVSCPAERPRDAVFDAEARPDVLVARGSTGHVLARVTLGGEGGWFVIDTGAGGTTILEASAAARLGLTAVGSTAIGSVDGIVRAPVLRAPAIAIGPLTLERPLVVALELAFVQGIFAEPVVGVIGWDLFSRCVAELTLAEETLRIHDPARYSLPAPAAWRRLVVHTRHPIVTARYENSRQGLFRVDVGAAGGALANVIFHTPTVERERLLDDRDYEDVRVGAYEVALGPMLWFELDGHRFERPVVAFARDHRGPFADAYIDGNVGVGFLAPFTLVLDTPGRRYALAPLPDAR